MNVADAVAAIIAGLVVMLNVIAPMTRSTKDDKLVSALRWFQEKVLYLLLPMLRLKAKEKPPE